ncbi:putative repeat protein (TIGR01451 family) [Sphingopyxis panaciterrae]|uniref:DUF11 domain-containing protein n=1 Tax=Sphingopyxis panaciterrae TaxID=363841 RepID=UPI001423E2FC|nr:DUF11 domain-containing protein [Sphingopyxis panaciterrae]NIJ36387.1 putative repeat protein (TIGR01451 family) [Sphingopyxis panaciterrae]
MRDRLFGVMACAAASALLAQPAAAQDGGALASKIELEKPAPAAAGQPPAKTYVAPDVVVPGDRIRITLTFTNKGAKPASGVKIVNPIPEGLVFDGTNDPAAFSVSVDGAKEFGALDTLTVAAQGAAPHAAAYPDVTHVRWLWPDAIAPGQSRSVAFFGRVK